MVFETKNNILEGEKVSLEKVKHWRVWCWKGFSLEKVKHWGVWCWKGFSLEKVKHWGVWCWKGFSLEKVKHWGVWCWKGFSLEKVKHWGVWCWKGFSLEKVKHWGVWCWKGFSLEKVKHWGVWCWKGFSLEKVKHWGVWCWKGFSLEKVKHWGVWCWKGFSLEKVRHWGVWCWKGLFLTYSDVVQFPDTGWEAKSAFTEWMEVAVWLCWLMLEGASIAEVAEDRWGRFCSLGQCQRSWIVEYWIQPWQFSQISFSGYDVNLGFFHHLCSIRLQLPLFSYFSLWLLWLWWPSLPTRKVSNLVESPRGRKCLFFFSSASHVLLKLCISFYWNVAMPSQCCFALVAMRYWLERPGSFWVSLVQECVPPFDWGNHHHFERHWCRSVFLSLSVSKEVRVGFRSVKLDKRFSCSSSQLSRYSRTPCHWLHSFFFFSFFFLLAWASYLYSVLCLDNGWIPFYFSFVSWASYRYGCRAECWSLFISSLVSGASYRTQLHRLMLISFISSLVSRASFWFSAVLQNIDLVSFLLPLVEPVTGTWFYRRMFNLFSLLLLSVEPVTGTRLYRQNVNLCSCLLSSVEPVTGTRVVPQNVNLFSFLLLPVLGRTAEC